MWISISLYKVCWHKTFYFTMYIIVYWYHIYFIIKQCCCYVFFCYLWMVKAYQNFYPPSLRIHAKTYLTPTPAPAKPCIFYFCILLPMSLLIPSHPPSILIPSHPPSIWLSFGTLSSYLPNLPAFPLQLITYNTRWMVTVVDCVSSPYTVYSQ